MKTLDQIIQDFEKEEVEGEGTTFSPSGAPIADFDTVYAPADQSVPATFLQSEYNGTNYDVDLDSKYQPTMFSVSWLRTHDLTQNMSDPLTKDLLMGLLANDPRWTFYNYKSNIQKVNNNLYRVKIDNRQLPGGVTSSRTVEFHIDDNDVLEKVRLVYSVAQYNVSKDMYSQEVNFVYPYAYDQDDDDDNGQQSTSSSQDDDKDDDNDVDTSLLNDLGF